MPATVGRRLPGGIPVREPQGTNPRGYAVGNKPLKVGTVTLAPGVPLDPAVIEAIPRLESWVRARRIVAL